MAKSRRSRFAQKIDFFKKKGAVVAPTSAEGGVGVPTKASGFSLPPQSRGSSVGRARPW